MIALYSFCGQLGPFKRCDSGPDWFLWLLGLLLAASIGFSILMWMRDRS